jgi:hypothetical protein
MANPEHLAKLKEGVDAWNRWRAEHPTVLPDLREANLGQAVLSKADLTEANLEWANLMAANLRDARLSGAYFYLANLSRATLYGADLTVADLSEASFDDTDFTGALIGYTTLANVDLSRAKGLEAVEHRGPSSIGIDTIYKSRGKIPYSFLLGCGAPEDFIRYIPSLVGTAIEFYSLFISYSTKDQEFAERLHSGLQTKGVRCWFAPHDIEGGRKIHEQIDEAIRLHDKLLLILSPESMKSEWVKTEISKARKLETKDGRQVLFPIRLCSFETLRDWECFDADAGKDSAREIREYFIPDFSNWKDHDAYKKAFDRLLKDLQGKAEPSPA